MKVTLLVIGKTDAAYIRAGIEEYEKRLGRYVPYEIKVLPDIKNSKNMSEGVQKEKEGELLLGQLVPTVQPHTTPTFPRRKRPTLFS